MTNVNTLYILLDVVLIIMEARLQKWGNSDGVRIPKKILKTLNLKINDILTLEQAEDKIIISKRVDNKVSLREKFKEYKGKNWAKDFSLDDALGKEIW